MTVMIIALSLAVFKLAIEHADSIADRHYIETEVFFGTVRSKRLSGKTTRFNHCGFVCFVQRVEACSAHTIQSAEHCELSYRLRCRIRQSRPLHHRPLNNVNARMTAM